MEFGTCQCFYTVNGCPGARYSWIAGSDIGFYQSTLGFNGFFWNFSLNLTLLTISGARSHHPSVSSLLHRLPNAQNLKVHLQTKHTAGSPTAHTVPTIYELEVVIGQPRQTLFCPHPYCLFCVKEVASTRTLARHFLKKHPDHDLVIKGAVSYFMHIFFSDFLAFLQTSYGFSLIKTYKLHYFYFVLYSETTDRGEITVTTTFTSGLDLCIFPCLKYIVYQVNSFALIAK